MPWTSGRLSVQVAADPSNAVRNLSASFDLRGDDQSGELRLSSPLGSLMAAARWVPGRAVLETSQGTVDYPDLESLAREALGEPLPLQALPDWVAGRAWQGASSQTLDTGFEQLGWRVNLVGFSNGQIDAERMTAPIVKLRVRLDKS